MATPVDVMTVLGPISSADLGPTLTHEHLMASATGADYDSTLHFDYEGQLIKITDDMKRLKDAGVSSIIDPIPMELGRKVDFMQDVSRASGVNVVCATGLYTDQGPFRGFPQYFASKSIDELEEIFVTEITEGVGPRKVKPGVIKCATGPHNVSENEEKALRASARAAKKTGVPITTHTTDGTMGPRQLDIFEDEGLDLRRVTVGHCSDSADLGYHVSMLRRGAYIGFDRLGLENFVDDETKIGVIGALVAMGFSSQIVFSHDNVGCMHGMRTRPMNPEKRRFTYLLESFVPELRRSGVSQDDIDRILIENPRRYFEGG